MRRASIVLALSALICLTLLPAGARSASLEGWYRFNDSANLGRDYSGNNNTAIVIDNGAPPVYTASGYDGGAADFLGAGKINMPFNTGPTLWPNLTWGGWALPDLVDDIRTVVNNDDGGYDRALNIDFRANGKWAAFVNDGPNPYSSGVTPSTSTWTFITGVYQDNYYGARQGRMTYYIGDQVFSDIRTYYGDTGWTYTSIGGSPTFGEFWNGRIDEFFVIGGAATPAQVAAIKADPNSVSTVAASVFAPSVAYWAPGSGAGGTGAWLQSNDVWSGSSNGSGTKGPWVNTGGVSYFGGTAGTVTVDENVSVRQAVFTTGGYVVQSGSGTITYYNTTTSTATINAQTGLTTIAANQTSTAGLRVTGNGTLALSGTTTLGSGQPLVVAGGNLRVNGLVAGSVNVASGSLGGSGQIAGSISGAGLVNPGNSPGILTSQSIDPSAGLDVALEFSGTAPNYGDATNSVNDVLRLTGGTPFTTGLTTANTKTLFLNFTKEQLTLGTILEGGFFTDTAFDFASLLNNQTWNNAGFQVYVRGDGQGTDNSLNGVGYYNWRNPSMFGWTQSLFLSTTARTANFGSGNVEGQVMLLTVAVPEPSTYAMALAGLACGGWQMWRRRKRTLCAPASVISVKGEQVAITGLLPSVVSRRPQPARTTLRTLPPLTPSDREYTPARSADRHLPEAHWRNPSILSPEVTATGTTRQRPSWCGACWRLRLGKPLGWC